MDVHINTHNYELSDEEHEAAVAAAKHLTKFHNHIIRVDVTASEDAGVKEIEFSVHVPGHTIVTKDTAPELTKAIHDVRDKVERQLKRISQRMHDVRSTLS